MKLYLKVLALTALLSSPVCAQDFLGNLPANTVVGRTTSTGTAQALTSTQFKSMFSIPLTITDNGLDELLGWDDSLGAAINLPLADILTEASPAAGDFVLVYGAEGDLRKVNWSTLPGVGSGITAVVQDTAPVLGGNLGGGAFTLGTSASKAADVYLEEGGIVDWDGGDCQLIQTNNSLDLTGCSLGIDATTETNIETAIDTLANLASVQGFAFDLDDNNLDELWGWDDSAATFDNFSLADLTTEAAPASGDFVIIYGAEGDVRKANWSTLPGAGAGISNVVEDLTPQLGGALDLNSQNITGTGNISITGSIVPTVDIAVTEGGTGAGTVGAAIVSFCGADPNADRFLFWDDSAGQCGYLTPPTNLVISTTTSYITESFVLAASDETTVITAATDKVTFRAPYGFTVTGVRCSLNVAQTSGSLFTVDINESGTTILSTKLTFDNNETTTTSAATAAVISDTAIANDAEVSIDVDTVGTGSPAGLKCAIIGHQ